MAEYRLVSGKSRALGVSSGLKCWSEPGLYTLNVLHGCPFECAYCKYRAVSHLRDEYYEIYQNLHSQLLDEIILLRKRNHPIRAVLMNSDTDAFCGDRRVEMVATRCLEVLAYHGVAVVVQTRGIIPESCLDILQSMGDSAKVVFNVPSVSREYTDAFEPRVPSLSGRRAMLYALQQRTIPVRGRIDPLVPMETDDDESVRSVLLEFARAGVTSVAVSYLTWSSEVSRRVAQRIDEQRWALLNQWFKNHEGVRRPLTAREYRLTKYRRLVALGKELGLSISVCACRNPDLSRTACMGELPELRSPTRKGNELPIH